MMYKITIEGQTRKLASSLRADKYRWNPSSQCWWKSVTDADAVAIAAGGEAAQDVLRAMRARRPGCQTRLSMDGNWGDVVYTSPTFATPAILAGHIPGSAPEDRVM